MGHNAGHFSACLILTRCTVRDFAFMHTVNVLVLILKLDGPYALCFERKSSASSAVCNACRIEEEGNNGYK